MAKDKKKSAKQVVVDFKENPLLNYGLLAIFFIFLVFFTTFKITGDDDVFWHLATGRFILQTGHVPSTDIFGFMTQGQVWMPFEWGWDVLTYSVYTFSGLHWHFYFKDNTYCCCLLYLLHPFNKV